MEGNGITEAIGAYKRNDLAQIRGSVLMEYLNGKRS